MIRTLYKSDLKQLLAIEQAVHVAPWAEETFKACFHNQCTGWAAEMDKQVIGFILISRLSDECHILNLCVDYPCQHQGWGRRLLEKAMESARQGGARLIYLEVRESNPRAVKLYENAGFQLIGRRRDYYPTVSGREDALVLAKSLVDG